MKDIGTLSSVDINLVNYALQYAAEAHKGQVRKYTGVPYIVHPMRVSNLFANRFPKHVDGIIAALLHDVVEDTHLTLENVHDEFGPAVADYVSDLTDVYTKEDYPNLNRQERKSLEASRFTAISETAASIKCCDLIDNTMDIVDHDPGFADVYLSEKAAVLGSLEGLADGKLWRHAEACLYQGRMLISR